MSAKASPYERDFYAWSQEQAELLRAGKADQADLENIAEEIESIGKGEKRELVNRLTILLLHLIKWRFQPMMRGRSWRLSIEGQRLDIEELLADNPSLQPVLAASIAQAWRRALIEAERETGLDGSSFPAACPWVAEELMRSDFWPE
jgi:Domain of unknown function DUF29